MKAERFNPESENNMLLEFEKIYSPVWCEGCDQQGYIFINDLEGFYFVKCKTCDWETSEVWCPKCGMGGEFVQNISSYPSSWNCPSCKTEYELPNGFYETPTMLFTEDVLPQTVRERIDKEIKSANNPWRSLLTTFTALLTLVVLVAVGLLPMVLVFTPLPWTIPGFIATLLTFVVWWWVIGKTLKFVRNRFTERSS